ncbi:MAG TPA: glucosyl-3-phosphoglycerate synthase [Solirubrobacteraceae bacterium]|nr:glucosyl-3-phosphoglycerate synthase [Solirubrobacteraceae bacterium]
MAGLRCVVAVPAKNEEGRIGSCLRALAAQSVGRESFEVIVVADACNDATEATALATARELGLRLAVIAGPGTGSGGARRAGMDAAAERLLSSGRPDGLLATTDADTCPAPDWLERQLAHLHNGAKVIAGLIELESEEERQLPASVLRRREADAELRLAGVRALDPSAAHHHAAGASLGMTAAVYRQVGGLEPLAALEDEAFAARLQTHEIQVLRASDVRVRTSARADGRAGRGLSVDLAVSQWAASRRYLADAFTTQQLRAEKDATVSVVIPAKRCAETIAGVITRTVGPLRDAGLVDELLVIDANSDDGTAGVARDAGAIVCQQDEIAPEFGPALGKGDAMWRALSASSGEIVCFLDGDTEDPDGRHLRGLLGPLLCHPEVQLVKGAFERPLRWGERMLEGEGGRVTELMARPLLNFHEPRLAGFSQPLAGEFAGRRPLLEALPFPVGYGVEIAVLIDALRLVGLDALAECDLGSRQNRHQPLRALGEMAYAVLAAVERRVGERSPARGHYMRPWEDYAVTRIPVEERPPLTSVAQQVA